LSPAISLGYGCRSSPNISVFNLFITDAVQPNRGDSLMMKSKSTPFILFLAVILFSPVIVQAGVPLEADGTVPAGPFQVLHDKDTDLQNQIDGIELMPGSPGSDGDDGLNGVLSGKGETADESTTADGEIYQEFVSGAAPSTSTSAVFVAYCADFNDIAITGNCHGNPNWSLYRSGIEINYDSINAARQVCIWNKPLADTSPAGAGVACIKVPGP
jgi:hypothetical protein